MPNNFLESVLKSLERAKDPILVGGILCVLVVGVLLYANKKSQNKGRNTVLYVVLGIASVCVLGGLYMKIFKTTKVIYGQLNYECQPASGIDVYTTKLRVTKTDNDGSFHFDISGTEFENLRLTFMRGKMKIGDTTIPVDGIKDDLKINFGNCSEFTKRYIDGYIIDRLTDKGVKNINVSIVGYNNYADTSDLNGYFSIRADSILKVDTAALELSIQGKNYNYPNWSLSTGVKGIRIPIDKKK